jgi:hypothetical protein
MEALNSKSYEKRGQNVQHTVLPISKNARWGIGINEAKFSQ